MTQPGNTPPPEPSPETAKAVADLGYDALLADPVLENQHDDDKKIFVEVLLTAAERDRLLGYVTGDQGALEKEDVDRFSAVAQIRDDYRNNPRLWAEDRIEENRYLRDEIERNLNISAPDQQPITNPQVLDVHKVTRLQSYIADPEHVPMDRADKVAYLRERGQNTDSPRAKEVWSRRLLKNHYKGLADHYGVKHMAIDAPDEPEDPENPDAPQPGARKGRHGKPSVPQIPFTELDTGQPIDRAETPSFAETPILMRLPNKNGLTPVLERYNQRGTRVVWEEHDSTASPGSGSISERRAIINAGQDQYYLKGEMLIDMERSRDAGKLVGIKVGDDISKINLVIGEPSSFSGNSPITQVILLRDQVDTNANRDAIEEIYPLNMDPFDLLDKGKLATIFYRPAYTNTFVHRDPRFSLQGDPTRKEDLARMSAENPNRIAIGAQNIGNPEQVKAANTLPKRHNRHHTAMSPEQPVQKKLRPDGTWDGTWVRKNSDPYVPRISEEAHQAVEEAVKKAARKAGLARAAKMLTSKVARDPSKPPRRKW